MQRLLTLGLGACVGCAAPAALDAARTWDFQSDAPEGPAAGFVVPVGIDGGPAGRWEIRTDIDLAPSPSHVLGQRATHRRTTHGNACLADIPPVADLRFRVHLRPLGDPAIGAGVVVRFTDLGHHYRVRWDVAAGQLVLERVHRAVAARLAAAPVDVPDLAKRPWHTLVVAVRGARIAAAFDDVALIDHVDDDPLLGAGVVGLWTPAPAAAAFDDLLLEPLDAGGTRHPSPTASSVEPLGQGPAD